MPSIPILMYHSVADASPPGLQTWTATPAQFAAQMAWLAEQGYNTLTVSQLVQMRQAGKPLPTRPIVLTFDDGYANFLSAAMPAMAKHGFSATLYVTTGFVDHQRHLFGTQPSILTWPQLREIQRSPWVEIGAHTHDHSPLDRLNSADAQQEITRPKQRLEQELGQRIESFCYPFGFNSAAVRAQVKAAGYTSACAIHYRMSAPNDDAFALSRFLIADSTDLDAFAQLVTGRGPKQLLLFQQARSSAWRLVRQALPKVPLRPIGHVIT